jgi:hypothetical protein
MSQWQGIDTFRKTNVFDSIRNLISDADDGRTQHNDRRELYRKALPIE